MGDKNSAVFVGRRGDRSRGCGGCFFGCAAGADGTWQIAENGLTSSRSWVATDIPFIQLERCTHVLLYLSVPELMRGIIHREGMEFLLLKYIFSVLTPFIHDFRLSYIQFHAYCAVFNVTNVSDRNR